MRTVKDVHEHDGSEVLSRSDRGVSGISVTASQISRHMDKLTAEFKHESVWSLMFMGDIVNLGQIKDRIHVC